MKNPRSFAFACLPCIGCGLLLAVLLPGCEISPPAPHPGARTENYSSGNGGTISPGEGSTPTSVRHRAPAPSSERVAARQRKPSAAAAPDAGAALSTRRSCKVEAEVQDPSELKSGDEKKPAPAKVEPEVRNPADLH